MGILKHLLFWPVTGPTFLARFSLEKVSDTVREELTSDAAIKEELLALQMRLELDEIDDEEYLAEETRLMRRLREVREWREEYGMGVSGGPVRVSASDPEALAEVEPAVDEGEIEGTADGRDGLASGEGANIELTWDRE